jgi:hypothetical protein
MVLPHTVVARLTWLNGKGTGTYPEVGARDGVWGNWFPLLRALLLATDKVACDWPAAYVQRGLPLQHQGGGPDLGHPHVIWGTCGVREGAETWDLVARQQRASQGGQLDRGAASPVVSQQAGQFLSHHQVQKCLLEVWRGPGQP